jgi:hypothetical protein
MWPFVSAYALRAARTTRNPERIAFEIRSLMRGAGKAGSNMENFELTTQSVHFEDGRLSGPVVNSPRQLWSVAAYLDMVMRGVFGVEDDGSVQPMIPAQLLSDLFGTKDSIVLEMPERSIELRKPKALGAATLLIGGTQRTEGRQTIVDLVPQDVPLQRLHRNGAQFAPPQPQAPEPVRDGEAWRIALAAGTVLYADGKRVERFDGDTSIKVPATGVSQCFSATRIADGIESLPSRTTCVGPSQTLTGDWPRTWKVPKTGRYRVTLRYRNANGPINTGITAGVKTLKLSCSKKSDCDGARFGKVVMPHNEADTDSTSAIFEAKAGAECRFSIGGGTNMSDLDHFVHYTGGKGGASGPLNQADIGTLTIVPLP